MRVDLFSKEQLLNGYIKKGVGGHILKKIFFASTAYHQLHVVHEDLLCDIQCYYFCERGYMVEYGSVEGALELERNELSLLDLY